MSNQSEEEQWLDAFQSKLKKRNFEQFSILLFDFRESSLEQKNLLHKILFDDHTSVTYWANYIEFACAKFDKKNHLQRLVNKALEFLDEKKLKDDASFLSIHLNSIKLKSTPEEMLRYFQNTLWKRGIGKLHAALYLSWSDLEVSTNGIENAVNILQKGIDSNAEPQQHIRDKLASMIRPVIQKEESCATTSNNPFRLKTLTYFDNGEVQFNKKVSVPVDQDVIGSQIVEKEEDATETQKIQISPDANIEVEGKKIPAALKRLKLSSSGSLGKSQRITSMSETKDVKAEAFPIDSESGEARNSQSQKFSQPSVLSSSTAFSKDLLPDSSSSKKKIDLSKYMDDSLKNFNPTARFTAITQPSNQSVTSSEPLQKKLPFSVLETNIDVPMQNQYAPKPASRQLTVNQGSHHMADNSHCQGTSGQNGAMEMSDDTEMATVKVQTEELKNLFAAIPKEPVKLASLPTTSCKRKRVSFTPQDEANADQRKSKEMKIQENQVASSSSSSSSSTSLQSHSALQHLASTLLEASFGIFADPEKYINVCGKRYVQTSLMGKGGSSAVKRVISCDDGVIYALKVVEIKDNEDSDSVFDSYANEISLLRKLKGTSPYIIDLVDSEISRQNLTVTMLLEAGDIDLAKLLNQKQKQTIPNGCGGLDPIFSRMVWKEMLLAVHHIHEHRIVHGDLKPANFVFVKGHLKLIDFGIAKSFSTDTTNIYRDSQIGTVNYMAPEAIAPTPESICHNRETNHYSMKLGRASDIWSLGCILYQIIFTRPPFAALNTIQKLSAIPNPKFEIQYPPSEDSDAVESIKACLMRNPKERSPIVGDKGLLTMKYLTIPCPLNATTSFNLSQQQHNHMMSDESAAIEKCVPIVLDSIKTAVAEKLSSRMDVSLFEEVFKSIDIHVIARNAMKGNNNNNITKELTSTDSAATASSTTKTIKDSMTRPKTPSKVLHAVDKENALPAKITNPVINKKSLGESIKVKSPMKILPLSLKQQIHNESNKLRSVQSAEGIANASKWQKSTAEAEPSDLRTALEKRIDQMRKFLSDDQENHTATESMDLSFSYNFV